MLMTSRLQWLPAFQHHSMDLGLLFQMFGVHRQSPPQLSVGKNQRDAGRLRLVQFGGPSHLSTGTGQALNTNSPNTYDPSSPGSLLLQNLIARQRTHRGCQHRFVRRRDLEVHHCVIVIRVAEPASLRSIARHRKPKTPEALRLGPVRFPCISVPPARRPDTHAEQTLDSSGVGCISISPEKACASLKTRQSRSCARWMHIGILGSLLACCQLPQNATRLIHLQGSQTGSGLSPNFTKGAERLPSSSVVSRFEIGGLARTSLYEKSPQVRERGAQHFGHADKRNLHVFPLVGGDTDASFV